MYLHSRLTLLFIDTLSINDTIMQQAAMGKFQDGSHFVMSFIQISANKIEFFS